MSKLTGIIDIHSHALLGIGRPSEISDPSKVPQWSVENTLRAMDENGIQAVMLSVPDSANHHMGAEARGYARRINETLAEIVEKHSDRFGAMATVPGRDIDATLEEMSYACDVLKLEGVCTSTNIDDVYLGEPRFEPWFSEMDRRGTTLFIHPMNTRTSKPLELGINPAALEFMFDTTRMITNLVLTGAKKRFANIRMIATHAGGTLPFIHQRVALAAALFGNDRGLPVQSPADMKAGFASFYYDLTGSTSAAQFTGLLDLVPTSQILFGFDMPYMPQASIAPAIDNICRFERFSSADIIAMSRTNAEGLYPQLAARLSA